MGTTQEAGNTKVVQDAYAAFGRGDVQSILNSLTDDIQWRAVIGAGTQVPYSGERRGKAAVAEFFKQVAEAEDFEVFEPKEFTAQGDTVVAVGHYRAKVKKTGRTFESDFAMVFTLKGGKVAAFREFTDSAAINAAF
jgi:ketosteroid isomerase-like protein